MKYTLYCGRDIPANPTKKTTVTLKDFYNWIDKQTYIQGATINDKLKGLWLGKLEDTIEITFFDTEFSLIEKLAISYKETFWQDGVYLEIDSKVETKLI